MNSILHTSHFLTFSHRFSRTRVAQFVSTTFPVSSACAHVVSVLIFQLLHSPLFAVNLLPYHPVFLPEYLGTLAEYDPLTGYEPNDYHISGATEPYIQEPQWKKGPSMTSSTMTIPSAGRSLHHCSFSSEKKQSAVDELVLCKSKVCRPVSRRLTVVERRDQLCDNLTHKFQT